MISLEMAKQLKASGLAWEPQVGDVYAASSASPFSAEATTVNDIVVSNTDMIKKMGRVMGLKGMYPMDSVHWVPSLKAMLDEVNKHGLDWNLNKDGFQLIEKRGMMTRVLKSSANQDLDTAVAEVLLWLKQQKTTE
ncbi:MAG: hypothetical protein HPY50_18260 [Firmicutes bacterium]|nr:hypothetical protein [Bacillota bacterium]